MAIYHTVGYGKLKQTDDTVFQNKFRLSPSILECHFTEHFIRICFLNLDFLFYLFIPPSIANRDFWYISKKEIRFQVKWKMVGGRSGSYSFEEKNLNSPAEDKSIDDDIPK